MKYNKYKYNLTYSKTCLERSLPWQLTRQFAPVLGGHLPYTTNFHEHVIYFNDFALVFGGHLSKSPIFIANLGDRSIQVLLYQALKVYERVGL